MTDMIADRERAVEITSHNVAACVHAALVERRMTVGELKEIITDWDPDLVDNILLGVNADTIGCRQLADIAYILGFDWRFTVNVRTVPPVVDKKKDAEA